MAEKHMYPGTFWTCQEELETYGYGDSCCTPECKSTTLEKNKIKTGIGMLSFPSDDKMRKKWLSIVKQFRRKGGHDNFTIKKQQKYVSFILTSAASKLVMTQAENCWSVDPFLNFSNLKRKKKRQNEKA